MKILGQKEKMKVLEEFELGSGILLQMGNKTAASGLAPLEKPLKTGDNQTEYFL